MRRHQPVRQLRPLLRRWVFRIWRQKYREGKGKEKTTNLSLPFGLSADLKIWVCKWDEVAKFKLLLQFVDVQSYSIGRREGRLLNAK
ncbi:hypothetical protein CMV_021459 [Castanea mollissima]|uniref:Uncharacterized protein n=1 Tax=Castanea mollissima TaxID=60419 RepID=A0A8J4QFQ8_9ROSI|nr:hypothetical protein CMV_021459 [Castanea mollissima]